MPQKKIAVIQDLSGFGRCSLTVAIPIVSALGVQCCPVPTSIFSNHTAYPHYFFEDYTKKMPEYISHWKRLGLSFDGIYTGFLGSKKQIAIVKEFIEEFGSEGCKVIIDPVMGDDGRTYATYTKQMCREMKKLVEYADILTPNLTEACILSDTPYRASGWKKAELVDLAKRLSAGQSKKVVITGIGSGEYIGNLVYEPGSIPRLLRTHKAGRSRCGTGDVFASIIAANAVKEIPFEQSVRQASDFVKACILRSDELKIPLTDGVCFEEKLELLTRKRQR
ncbi:pyridoxamine kinase [Lachnotalea sp. AF33-28]|uniref:pyridoxamine kinase n=1 Tax=Lachnotalea sp. AF33-28 TaxID=2292046 RepID=UPI000E477FC9|nr:pyridoxamine kinase [Lachnotalea sp. AF33-28]RHP29909.1 pyridoxamine kinase [Lachnotalea sp. AF33-28]